MKKISNQEKIRFFAEQREVQFLLHFTQFINLGSIVEHGLLSRADIKRCGYTAYYSDLYRLDGDENAISASISQVNERVFAEKRRKNGHTDWVVLGLSTEILWTHHCRFSWRNAAKKEITNHRGNRAGLGAFERMFAGGDEARSHLPLCFTTDPEAEVQVLEPIAPSCILGALVLHPKMIEPVQAVLGCLPGDMRQVFKWTPAT